MPDGHVCRGQSKRYPWWVKSVDTITTQVDDAIMEKPKGTVIQWLFKQPIEHIFDLVGSGKEKYSQRVQNDEPGTRLQDVPQVDLNLCFGCAVCATGCPSDAVQMVNKPEFEAPPKNQKELMEKIFTAFADQQG